jgi:hypothetical protein
MPRSLGTAGAAPTVRPASRAGLQREGAGDRAGGVHGLGQPDHLEHRGFLVVGQATARVVDQVRGGVVADRRDDQIAGETVVDRGGLPLARDAGDTRRL